MWKNKFTNEVVPKLDKGMKIVGYDNYGNPCEKCYTCSVFGGDGSCITCYYSNRDGMDMSFKEYQSLSIDPITRMCKDVFEFKRYINHNRIFIRNMIKINLWFGLQRVYGNTNIAYL
jgi:hypothetical protein